MITLGMIDQVRERVNVSFKEAKDALEATGGDPLEAIILLETKKQHKGIADNMTDMGNEIVETLKNLVKKGNLTRITLEKEGKSAVDIPIVAGALGAVFFTPATVAAILASLVAGYQLKIVKDDGSIIDIKDMTEDTIQTVKTRVDEIKTRLSKAKEEGEAEVNEEGRNPGEEGEFYGQEGEILGQEEGIEVEIQETDPDKRGY